MTKLLPVGPWQCLTCNRELLLIVDAGSAPGIRQTVRDQCGTEHFAPGHIMGFFWKDEDGDWLEVEQPQAREKSERQPKIA